MAPDSYQLVMRTGPTPGKAFALIMSEIYLGRDITNDIVINDPEVSRKHARLTLQTGGYLLEDLGSTNGTFVDGQRISGPQLLVPAAMIYLGDNVTLSYEVIVEDPEATRAVASQFESSEQSAETPAPQQPVFPEPTPMPELGPPPISPPPLPAQPPPQRGGARMWFLAGCGCLLVLACVIIAGAYVFDTMNLYCQPPFDTLFPCP